MFKLSIIAAAVLALSACSGGPNAEAERNETQNNQLSFSVSASRSLTASRNLSQTAQVPLTYYIQEVARDINFATGAQVKDYMFNVFSYNLPPITSSGAEWAKMTSPTGEITDEHRELALKQAEHIEHRLGEKGAAADVALRHLKRCVDFVLTTPDYVKARECYSNYYTRASVAASIATAYYPQVVPLVNSSSLTTGKVRTYSGAIVPWALGAMAVIDVTNQAASQIADTLGGVILADDEAAKEALALALFEMPTEPLRAGQKHFKDNPEPGESAVYFSQFPPAEKVQDMIPDPGDIGDPIKVAFPELNRHITQDGRGLTEMRAGSLHFGAEVIAGKKYTLSVANSTAATMTKQDDSRSNQDTGAGASTRSRVTLGTQ